MSLTITETFGYPATDTSSIAQIQRKSLICPFIKKECWKKFRAGGLVNGTCVVKPPMSAEVIICPDRLYAENFKILSEVAKEAFGREMSLVGPSDMNTVGGKDKVVVFGKRWGRELRVPKNNSDMQGYSADWILAHVDEDGKLQEFVPVEVQTMDTTGSYQGEWYKMNNLELPAECKATTPSMNWENVNKRIIPQLLTKGNVFGREALCRKGLFFVCPTPVYNKLIARLGAVLTPYPMRSGTLTFRCYGLAATCDPGQIRPLRFEEQLTTTIENLKDAFNSTLRLPSMGLMTQTIQRALDSASKARKKSS